MPAVTPTAGQEMPLPRIQAEEMPVEGVEIFRDPERVREYLGIQEELEMNDVLKRTDRDKLTLLDRIRDQSPEVNGNVEKALEQIKLNIEQLQKKEGFFKKVLKFPLRHPILTLLALLILLSYFPALAPGGGAYGQKLISAMKGVLMKVGVPVPEPAVEAVSKIAGTGGPVPPELVQEAAEIGQSPGQIDALRRALEESSSTILER